MMRHGFNAVIKPIALLSLLLGGALMLGGALLLGGCCTANLMLRKCPARIDLRLTASEQLNSCTGHGTYQVMVRLYYLDDTKEFGGAEFEKLWDETSDLSGAILGEVMSLTVQPGQEGSYQWRRPQGTRAIGVVANFCRHDLGCWKQIVEIAEGSRRVDLVLEGTCLKLEAHP